MITLINSYETMNQFIKLLKHAPPHPSMLYCYHSNAVWVNNNTYMILKVNEWFSAFDSFILFYFRLIGDENIILWYFLKSCKKKKKFNHRRGILSEKIFISIDISVWGPKLAEWVLNRKTDLTTLGNFLFIVEVLKGVNQNWGHILV